MGEIVRKVGGTEHSEGFVVLTGGMLVPLGVLVEIELQQCIPHCGLVPFFCFFILGSTNSDGA